MIWNTHETLIPCYNDLKYTWNTNILLQWFENTYKTLIPCYNDLKYIWNTNILLVEAHIKLLMLLSQLLNKCLHKEATHLATTIWNTYETLIPCYNDLKYILNTTTIWNNMKYQYSFLVEAHIKLLTSIK